MIVVVGGGINGLAAAIVLAKQGRSVVVLEQQADAGGAATTTEIAPGYHAPGCWPAIPPLDPLVVRGIGLSEADLRWLRPAPALTVIAGDGAPLRLFDDEARTARAIEAVSARDAARWSEYGATLAKLAGVLAALARQVPPDIDAPSMGDLIRLLATARAARQLGSRDLARLLRYTPMAVADIAAEWFESEALQTAVCAHAIYGHLAGPWSAGTGAILLQRLAADPAPFGSGLAPAGGPGALGRAMAAAAARAGVTVRRGARVVRVIVKDGRATGVALESGEEIGAESVLCAIDPRQTFLALVEPGDLPPSFRHRISHFRARGVTAVAHFALDGMPPWHDQDGRPAPPDGRMLIAASVDDLERAYDAAKYGACSPRPWLEVTIPTLQDPSIAPAGGHVMSVVAHYAPYRLAEGTWDAEREALLRRVLSVLDDHFPGLDRRIAGAEVLTPVDIERRWGLSGGHVFQGELTLDQTWAARPLLGWARHETPIRGLFLASGHAHPGVPGVLAATTLAQRPA